MRRSKGKKTRETGGALGRLETLESSKESGIR